MHVTRIGLPYPIFSVLLFELHTGVTPAVFTRTTTKGDILELALSEATDITLQRDTLIHGFEFLSVVLFNFSVLQTHYICDFRTIEILHSPVTVVSTITLWKEMILWKFVYVAQGQKET